MTVPALKTIFRVSAKKVLRRRLFMMIVEKYKEPLVRRSSTNRWICLMLVFRLILPKIVLKNWLDYLDEHMIADPEVHKQCNLHMSFFSADRNCKTGLSRRNWTAGFCQRS